jgi:outer membrane protein assembly factor BamB
VTFLGFANPDAAASGATYDWLQFNGSASHGGNDTSETTLSTANVSSLVRRFRVALPAPADGAPVELANVATAGGTRNLLFVTTTDGRIIALDAGTGQTVWSHQNGPGTCLVNNGSQPCFTTSSPAIDPTRAYVYSYGLEGQAHKYAVADGAEITTGGWPELVTNKPYNEKTASALAIATAASGVSYLYVASGGYPGDYGDYQGHITAISLLDGSQHVFNSQCSNQTSHFAETPGTPDCSGVQSAAWARAGVVYDAAVNEIFFGTGNGNFAPASFEWGDSVIAIHPDGTGAGSGPIDSYTPATFTQLQNADWDLGSTAPALLPTPSTSAVHHLALQSGKDSFIRLLNLDNLSGQSAPGNTGGEVTQMSVPQGGQVLTAPAVWVNPADASTWTFVANSNGISGLKLGFDAGGNPSLTMIWKIPSGGTSPVIANGVLYVAASANIRALDPVTGTQLWNDTTIGNIHWASPIVANATLYVSDGTGSSGEVSAYGLGNAAPAPAPALPRSCVWLALATMLFFGARQARALERERARAR